jgi:hypothetical protein
LLVICCGDEANVRVASIFGTLSVGLCYSKDSCLHFWSIPQTDHFKHAVGPLDHEVVRQYRKLEGLSDQLADRLEGANLPGRRRERRRWRHWTGRRARPRLSMPRAWLRSSTPYDRVADATGIPLEDWKARSTEDVQAAIGIDAFAQGKVALDRAAT